MKGFTLIELLVVVLIIGILSAVAVPQYQKAVEKSRAAQALAVLKSMGSAMESYYLANGKPPTRFDELDIELDWSGTDKWYSSATDTRSNGEWSLQILENGANAAVYMGRLTGKYKGSGFGYFLKGSASYQTHKVTCLERINSGIAFEGQAGEYCQQVFNGILQATDGNTRQYTLP